MTVSVVRLGDVLRRVDERVELQPRDRYRVAGVRAFGRGVFEKDPIGGADTKYSTLTRIEEGQLVYSKLKAFEGAIAVVGSEQTGCHVSSEFPVYAPWRESIDAAYLFHVVQEEGFRSRLRRVSQGVGARRERVNPRDFEAIRIPLPSIEDQRGIADRLDRVQAAATSLADGRLHLNAVEVVAGEREWDTPLSELLELDVDEFDVEDDAVYQRAGVLNAGRGLFSQGELQGRDTKYRKLRRVRSGQVVLSRLTAFIGGVAYVQPIFEGFVLSQEYPTFSLRAGVAHEYVQSLMRTADVAHQLRGASAGVGNTRQRVSAESFLTIRVPLLTAAEQLRVADLHRRLVRHEELVSHRATLAAALLPAARNEVFSRLG